MSSQSRRAVVPDDEVTIVDVDADGELLAAMKYLAALAFPESHDDRNRFIAALYSRLVRTLRAAGRDVVGRPELSVKDQKAMNHRGFNRILKRLRLVEALSPELPGLFLPEGVPLPGFAGLVQFRPRLSRSKRIESTMQDPRAAFRHSRASARVLHLALALHSAQQELKENGVAFALVMGPGWVRLALRRAERHADFLRSVGVVTGPQIRLQEKEKSPPS